MHVGLARVDEHAAAAVCVRIELSHERQQETVPTDVHLSDCASQYDVQSGVQAPGVPPSGEVV